ncbi:hypothetical protein CKO24_05985 [Rhodothalassium salexigens DSM 2132]|nr:hypothetical protein [Rhodothalassium salexigens DSM 2132]
MPRGGFSMLRLLPRLLVAGGVWLALMTPAAVAQQAIGVRGGEHDDYSRLVIDFANARDVTVEGAEDGVVLRVDTPTRFDVSAVDTDALSRVDGVAQFGAAGLRVATAGGRGLDVFRLGNRLVIDIYGAVDTAEAAADERSRRREELGRPALAGLVAPVSAGAGGRVGELAPAADPAAAAEASVDRDPQSRGGVPDGQQSAAEEFPERFEAQRIAPEAASYARVAVAAESLPDGLAFDFAFDDPRFAAVFIRSGYLWVVFSGRVAYDLSGLDFDSPVLTGRVNAVQRLRTDDVSALRFNLAMPQSVAADRDGNSWRVTLKDKPTAPLRPLRLVEQSTGAGTQVFVPVEETFRKVMVTDPSVGDQLLLVAVREPNRGVREGREFADFAIPRTAQGLVVVPQSDRAQVQRFHNGVAIAARDVGEFAKPQAAAAFAAMGDLAGPAPRRLIDLQAWRLDDGRSFGDRRADLVAAIAALPDNERNEGRWDLARFLLAHDQAAEARGVLELMAAEDQALAETPRFRAVRGVVNQMLGRTAAALEDLNHPELREDPDASIWRTLAAEAEGDPMAALDAFRVGRDILGYYQPQWQGRFLLAAARSALLLDQVDQTRRLLDLIDQLDVNKPIAGEALVLKARLAAEQGDIARALDLFETAIAFDDPRTSAMARLERVRFALRHEGLTKREAVEDLEGLRFDWRGRDFEIDVLSTLGQLYVSIGEYRKGLKTMRQVVEYYPDDPRTGQVVRRMQGVFETIFLESNAQDLTPFDAVALFQDFRELTPQGAAGDRIIRRLVDRLVAVDLLDRAADLLRYQVTYRLEGAAQAQIAGRLAMVHLLNKEPEKALDILRATRSGGLPDEIERQRRFVEARALAEMDRYEEAIAMLEGFQGPQAEVLRADIYWDAKDWPMVARHHAGLLAKHTDAAELSAEERLWVVRRAVALMYQDDQAALRELSDTWGVMMNGGPFEQVFQQLTTDRTRSAGSTKELAQKIADVDSFRSFLDAYRREFAEQSLAEAVDTSAAASDGGDAASGGP